MKCVRKMFVWQPRYADNKVKIIKYLEKLKKTLRKDAID